MKLYSVLNFLIALGQIEGFTIQSNPTKSSFVGTNVRTIQYPSIQMSSSYNRRSMTMYEPSFDPPRKTSVRKLKSGFWVALDHTEKWISETLSGSSTENPHARKEVTYECELNQYPLGSIAGIFR